MGFWPVREKVIVVKIVVRDVVDAEFGIGNVVVDALDLADAALDIVMDAHEAVARDVDFVGKHKSGINDVVDFGAVAVMGDGVTDDSNVSFAERGKVAPMGLKIRTSDTGAVFGMPFFAANHAAIVQEAGDGDEVDLMIVTASFAGKIGRNARHSYPMIHTMVATELDVI